MKPICKPCHRFFHRKKNGVYFTEGMPTNKGAAPGTAEAHLWKPYKLWSGDEWECHGCGATIIVGVGSERIAEHYEPEFPAVVERFGADQFQVNDC